MSSLKPTTKPVLLAGRAAAAASNTADMAITASQPRIRPLRPELIATRYPRPGCGEHDVDRDTLIAYFHGSSVTSPRRQE
jgi:hypothetical protein